jgi:hypothetical protein
LALDMCFLLNRLYGIWYASGQIVKQSAGWEIRKKGPT